MLSRWSNNNISCACVMKTGDASRLVTCPISNERSTYSKYIRRLRAGYSEGRCEYIDHRVRHRMSRKNASQRCVVYKDSAADSESQTRQVFAKGILRLATMLSRRTGSRWRIIVGITYSKHIILQNRLTNACGNRLRLRLVLPRGSSFQHLVKPELLKGRIARKYPANN